MSEDPPPSPLTEPSLAELFAADPTTLSDSVFLRIIAKYRQERKQWAELDAKPKASKADKAAAPAKPKVEKGAIKDLGDLGI